MKVQLNLQNKIINGCFDFWQRGVSFSNIAANAYSADRWKYSKGSTLMETITKSSDVPPEAFGVNSLKVTVTTASPVLAAEDHAGVYQIIEGNVLRTFKGKKMVLSFWFKSSKVGTYCVSFRNTNAAATRRTLVKEFQVNEVDAWEKKTIRFTHNHSGEWDYGTGQGLMVFFTASSGSNFIASVAGEWLDGNFIATASQVNAADTVGAYYNLADVVLVEDNEGQTREPEFTYAGRDYPDEFQLCQRYYEEGEGDTIFRTSTAGGWGGAISRNPFKVVKRAIPTVRVFADASKTFQGVKVNGTTNNSAINHAGWIDGLNVWNNGALDAAIGTWASYHWTADAEL